MHSKISLTRLFAITTTCGIGIGFAVGPVGADSSATDPLSIHTGYSHLSILHNVTADYISAL